MRPGFLLREVGNGLRRGGAMFLAVALVTMVSLFFLGAGLLAQRQVETAQGYWYDRVEVSIFLCTSGSGDVPSCADGAVTDAQRETLRDELDSLTPELIAEYFYEDSDEAYERFREQFDNSTLLDRVPPEAIPESFRVRLADPAQADVVSSAFTGAPGVESVEDQRALLDRFFTFLGALSLGAVGMAAAMLLCSVLLVTTTIRQSAYTRRRETGFKRLVGASSMSIALPFVVETLLAVLVGAALAVGLLWLAVHYGISQYLTDAIAGEGALVSLIGTGDLWTFVPWLVLGALALAALTSWLALRRYVKL